MRIEKVKEKTFGYHNYDEKEITENKNMILKWISNNVKNYQFYTIDEYRFFKYYTDVIIRVYEEW